MESPEGCLDLDSVKAFRFYFSPENNLPRALQNFKSGFKQVNTSLISRFNTKRSKYEDNRRTLKHYLRWVDLRAIKQTVAKRGFKRGGEERGSGRASSQNIMLSHISRLSTLNPEEESGYPANACICGTAGRPTGKYLMYCMSFGGCVVRARDLASGRGRVSRKPSKRLPRHKVCSWVPT